MNTDSYRQDLEQVASSLRQYGASAEIRGEGPSSFIYSHHEGRSIELSWDGVGVFIGMFEGDADTSLRDEQQDTYGIALESALGWLFPHKNTAKS